MERKSTRIGKFTLMRHRALIFESAAKHAMREMGQEGAEPPSKKPAAQAAKARPKKRVAKEPEDDEETEGNEATKKKPKKPLLDPSPVIDAELRPESAPCPEAQTFDFTTVEGEKVTVRVTSGRVICFGRDYPNPVIVRGSTREGEIKEDTTILDTIRFYHSREFLDALKAHKIVARLAPNVAGIGKPKTTTTTTTTTGTPPTANTEAKTGTRAAEERKTTTPTTPTAPTTPGASSGSKLVPKSEPGGRLIISEDVKKCAPKLLSLDDTPSAAAFVHHFPFGRAPQDQVKYIMSSEFMIELSLVLPMMFESPYVVSQLLSRQVFHIINSHHQQHGKFVFFPNLPDSSKFRFETGQALVASFCPKAVADAGLVY